jgi:hypothetical protein
MRTLPCKVVPAWEHSPARVKPHTDTTVRTHSVSRKCLPEVEERTNEEAVAT